MVRCAFAVFVVLSFAIPAWAGEPAATPLQASIAKAVAESQRNLHATSSAQTVSGHARMNQRAAAVAALAVAGFFIGLYVTDRAVHPTGEDPETTTMTGGLVGGAAGGIAGYLLTSR